MLTDEIRIELSYAGILGTDDEPIDQRQLDKAEKIILAMLASGEAVPAYQIYNRGEIEEISVETMKRAKKLHNISTRRKGKIWVWQLNNEL